MKQVSLGLNLSTKKTRKRAFLDDMERVVPWKVLVEIIKPHWLRSKTGCPPFAIETMLRIHYMQQWFGLSDPAMEEALHDVPLYLEFAGLGSGASRIPDETTILRFRHLLEKHDLAVDMLRVLNDLLQHKGLMLKAGTAVDATLISAPSSTKNASGERDPEMKQSKEGNQWYFGMKAHIGAMLSRARFIRCAVRRAMSMTWSKPPSDMQRTLLSMRQLSSGGLALSQASRCSFSLAFMLPSTCLASQASVEAASFSSVAW